MGEKKYSTSDKVLLVVVLSLFAILFYSVFNRSFDHDEFEHIHSAWLLLEGQIPYTDFFQHHNGLLWILIAPIIAVFGETVTAIFAVRVFTFLILLGTAFITYKSVKTMTGSVKCALFTLLWLFVTDIFHAKSIEVRPELPQTFFIMLSFYFLINYLQLGQKVKDLSLSFLSVSIAFVFIQKTAFYIAAYCAVLFIIFITKKLPIKTFLKATPWALLPLIASLAYLLASGSLNDYWITNWPLNLKWIGSSSPGKVDALVVFHIVTLVIGMLISFGYIFMLKKKPLLALAGFLGLIQFFAAIATGKYLKQYFYPVIFFFSIVGADLFFIIYHNVKKRYKPAALTILTCLLLLSPLFPLNGSIKLLYSKYGNNSQQINRIDYVLKNTTKNDFVYDGDIQFNVFRKDLHYFWFSVKPGAGLESYQKNIGNKYDDYDIYKLIDEKKPKFISDHSLNFEEETLSIYEKGKYGLYLRKE